MSVVNEVLLLSDVSNDVQITAFHNVSESVSAVKWILQAIVETWYRVFADLADAGTIKWSCLCSCLASKGKYEHIQLIGTMRRISS